MNTDNRYRAIESDGDRSGVLNMIREELDKSSGSLTMRQLALKTGVEENVLEGMLGFLSRKGVLEYRTQPEEPGGGCRGYCPCFCRRGLPCCRQVHHDEDPSGLAR